jgi:hypothetical protein
MSQQDLIGNYNRQQGLTKQEAIEQLTRQIESLNAQLEKLTLDDPLPSPTQRQLNANPALQNAWNEFNVIWKLTGK